MELFSNLLLVARLIEYCHIHVEVPLAKIVIVLDHRKQSKQLPFVHNKCNKNFKKHMFPNFQNLAFDLEVVVPNHHRALEAVVAPEADQSHVDVPSHRRVQAVVAAVVEAPEVDQDRVAVLNHRRVQAVVDVQKKWKMQKRRKRKEEEERCLQKG